MRRALILADAIAQRIQQQTGLTGVGIGVSVGKDPAIIQVAGLRKRGGLHRLQCTDRWHIGSIGKSATALLIASCFEHNSPLLDQKLAPLFPDIDMHAGWATCTLYHLLTSSSGLPANFPLKTLQIQEEDPGKLTTIRHDLLQTALAKAPKSACGATFRYSNLGYSLLGHIAERQAGVPFAQLMSERILNPLQLTDTGFGAPRGTTEDDQPMGHQVFFGWRRSMDPFQGTADLTPVIAPAGRLHMSLPDLLKYGRAHLDGERGDNPLLQQKTWQLLHRPYLSDYGCGWVSQRPDWVNGRLIWHNGSNRMWYALLLLLPEQDCVMAFTTNDGAIRRAEKAFFAAAPEILATVT